MRGKRDLHVSGTSRNMRDNEEGPFGKMGNRRSEGPSRKCRMKSSLHRHGGPSGGPGVVHDGINVND